VLGLSCRLVQEDTGNGGIVTGDLSDGDADPPLNLPTLVAATGEIDPAVGSGIGILQCGYLLDSASVSRLESTLQKHK